MMNLNHHRKRSTFQQGGAGGLKRKLPPSEDGDQLLDVSDTSDSQFIKGSKGSSSFSNSPLKAIRPGRRRNDIRDSMDAIPEDLKTMFSHNKSKDVPNLSLKHPFSRKPQVHGISNNQIRYDSNRSPLRRDFEESNHQPLAYSEDNIFLPNSDQFSKNEHFFIQPSSFSQPPKKFFFPPYNSKGDQEPQFPHLFLSDDPYGGLHDELETEETNSGDLTFKPEMTNMGSFNFFGKQPFGLKNEESSTNSNPHFSFQSIPREECDLFSPLKSRRSTVDPNRPNQERQPLFGANDFALK